jgi:hypothetical protein
MTNPTLPLAPAVPPRYGSGADWRDSMNDTLGILFVTALVLPFVAWMAA